MTRRDPLRVRDYLEHIAEATANIRDYTAGMDVAAYLADRKTQDAVVAVTGTDTFNWLRQQAMVKEFNFRARKRRPACGPVAVKESDLRFTYEA